VPDLVLIYESVTSSVSVVPWFNTSQPKTQPSSTTELLKSESYITTDGQSDSLSWNEAPPSGAYDQIFITVRQLRVC
jgi:hypothetical protein